MMRAMMVGLLLTLAACDSVPLPSAPPSVSAQEDAGAAQRVIVRVEGGGIFWNGEAVDESELARRAAAHWSRNPVHVITIDTSIPDPNDANAMTLSLKVGRLIQTKQAALEETLRKLADGTY